MIKAIGLQFRKIDIINFVFGFIIPVFTLFFVYKFVGQNTTLNSTNYLSLLLNEKNKLVHYFIIAFIEEILFRGIVFGYIFKNIKKLSFRIILTALIFAIPHSINTNAPMHILLLFSFLYGMLANEMFYFTKSIWLSTAFHWAWNYSIVSVFMTTNTSSYIYILIIVEIAILIPIFYILLKKYKVFYK